MKRITLCAVLLSLAVISSACAASSSSYDSAASSSAPAATEALPPSADYAFEADEYISPNEGAYGGDGGQESALPLLTQNDDPGSKMVYTVSLDLQTTAFDDGTRGLLTTVREMGGYVVGAHINGRSLYSPDTERWARYTLRIPSERLADFLVTMEDNYNLWQLDQQSQDIARQYTQTDMSLEYLREQEARLQETLGQTEDSKVRADLERQLREVQSRIASSSASMNAMEKDVTYSMVTIQLYEVFEARIPKMEEPKPVTFVDRLGDTSLRSWNGFVSFLQGLLLFIIAILPAVVVIGAVVILSVLMYRLLKKRGVIKPSVKKAENRQYIGYPSPDQQPENARNTGYPGPDQQPENERNTGYPGHEDGPPQN